MGTRSNLLITGGWAHDFEHTAPELAALIDGTTQASVNTTVVDDLDEAARAMNTHDFDVLTVYACWFRMLDPRYSEENRTTWARTLSPELRAGLEKHRDAGKPLFAMHTAPICFDEWPEWGEWIGGAWQWGTSFHPAPAELTIDVTGDHPIVSGLATFTITDERYSKLARSPRSAVQLASRPLDPDATGTEPTLWVHDRPQGRAVFNALGHSVSSLQHPTHRTIVRRAITWLLGEPDHVVKEIA